MLRYQSIHTWLTPTRAVTNSYGPTEITVASNAWRVEYKDLPNLPPSSSSTIPPIGSPRANTRILIVNPKTLNVLPVGVVGEILIGGVGLARSYTTLNAGKFVLAKDVIDSNLLSLFHNQETDRLYRTGDLGRWLPDGTVQCVGRTDSQIKLRGIELDGITSALCSHPLVANAAVLLQGESLTSQIVAYVECKTEGETHNTTSMASLLRSFTSSLLPSYMVPSTFVIGSLPRAKSGKIDKKALTAPISKEDIPHQPSLLPATSSAETTILQIFCRVLRLDHSRVGVEDNFFELGGNSLLAARLLTQLHSQYHIALPLTTIFSHPTVRLLATALGLQPLPTPPAEAKVQPPQHSPIVDSTLPPQQSEISLLPPQKFPVIKIQDGEVGKTPLFCIHPAGGTGLCFYPLALEMPEYPVYALEDHNDGSDETYSYSSINDMAKDYVSAIQTIQPKGPYYLIGFSMGGAVAHTMATILSSQKEEVALVVSIDGRLRAKDFNHEADDVKISELFLQRLEAVSTSENGQKDDNQTTKEEKWNKIEALLSKMMNNNNNNNNTPNSQSQSDNKIASSFALRFVSLFKKHLKLISEHEPPIYDKGSTIILMCKGDRAIMEATEREWSAKCNGEEEIVFLPNKINHTNVLYPPHVKYVASILRGRISCSL